MVGSLVTPWPWVAWIFVPTTLLSPFLAIYCLVGIRKLRRRASNTEPRANGQESVAMALSLAVIVGWLLVILLVVGYAIAYQDAENHF